MSERRIATLYAHEAVAARSAIGENAPSMSGEKAVPADLHHIFPGESEMARRMRSYDWSQNPLVLGLPAHIVWEEVWPELGPRVEHAMRGTEGTYDEALMLVLLRKGFPEEMYVTFSYSPILDDEGRVGGIICPATEETERIIGERQMALLRELAARTADARTHKQATELASSALQTNPTDLPFSLIYLIDPDKRSASLIQAAGVSGAPQTVSLDAPGLWPLAEVLRTHGACLVSDLTSIANDLPVAHGYRVTQALAMPVTPAGDVGAPCVLVVGLNPLRALDDGYRRFLDLVTGGISAAITSAQAYDAERRRAEELAELDRAKTAFFSNVSHEFRTPLTLMLGPLEDELQKSPKASHNLQIAHRNGLRLLKLVNTLLDFARIEAGRIQASYEPTDLSTFTAELASSFRAAVERAGLRLIVECPALPEPVFIDRDMWEKIVLNLVSNAFKFTLEGEIEVRLEPASGEAVLTVRDTGIGIAPEELSRVFERFHRVKDARGRTHEGTGIGLRWCRSSPSSIMAPCISKARSVKEASFRWRSPSARLTSILRA
jgi:signal transduction histidine kinase